MPGFAHKADRVPRQPAPPNVRVETHRWSLRGETVPVDVYLRAKRERAQVVLPAHGFTRHRRKLFDQPAPTPANDPVEVLSVER